MRKVALSVLALFAGVIVDAQREGGLLATANRGMFVHDSEMIVPSKVARYTISRSGQFLLAVGSQESHKKKSVDDPAELIQKARLTIWDARARKAYTIDAPFHSLSTRVTWVGASDIAIIEASNYSTDPSTGEFVSEDVIYMLDCQQKRLRKIGDIMGEQTFTSFYASSRYSLVAIIGMKADFAGKHAENILTITMLNERGQVQRSTKIELPFQLYNKVYWSKDNSKLVIGIRTVGQPGERVLLIDAKTLKHETLERYNEVDTGDNGQQDAVIAYADSTTELDGKSVLMSTVWLRSATDTERRSVLIANGSRDAQISPDWSYVAYQLGSAIYVRQIEALSLEQYREMLIQEERGRALSEAKQLGLGLLMFAADNKDQFPSSEDLQNSLSKYLKNGGAFDRMTFHLSGEKISDIENPAEVQMATIETDFGRAIVYADGHAQWVKSS